MPWAVLKSASDRLLESPSPHIEMVFAGGEPLIELGHIRRVVDYIDHRKASNRSVRYSLATNGTMLSSEVIAFLDRHRFDVDVSFDGVPLAQSVRGRHSFARVDGALGRLCAEAPETFWGRLTVGVTLDAKAVSSLSESFAYFLERHVRAVVLSPVNGQSAKWTPPRLDVLERALTSVFMIARRHYEDTGQVPLAAFRRRSDDVRAASGVLCGAASSSNVAVDVDGEVYACPFLAESSQRFANQRLAAAVRPMRLGHIGSRAFWRRLAELPARAEETRMFRIGPERRSLHGRCLECPHHLECMACPISVLSEPDHEDAHRIPDYICAFNWILMSLRKEFPVQPDAAALLEGRAPKPRLARELLERAGAGRQGLRPGLLRVAEGRPPSGSPAPS
jgi:sulfatase maturation enzyme AslB (radical SAM superfamily)